MNDLSSFDVIDQTEGHRRLRLRGGPQDGVEVVEMSSGGTTVAVCPTRGMGLLWMESGGDRAEWHSPVAGPVHPSLVDLGGRGGLGWLDGFSELLVRCGLSFNGPPGEDEAAGPINGGVTLHGRIANTPAAGVRVVEEAGGVACSGVVTEATLFGPRLEMRSEVRVAPTGEVVVRDVVANRGGRPAEAQLLYHVNVGPPFLGEGSTIRVSASDACPRDARSAEGVDGWNRCGPPEAGFEEQAYFFKTAAGADGRAVASITDAAGGRTFSVDFEAGELPCATVWKCTQEEADGYVVGLEPGTGWPNFKAHERERGRVRTLEPGAEAAFGVTLRITHGGPPDVWPRPVMLGEPAGW